MCNFGIRYGDLFRYAGHQIAPLHSKISRWIGQFGQCGTNLNFNFFGSTVTNHNIMLAADVLNNVRIEVITRYADRLVAYDTRQRDNRNFGSTAANIDDHVTHRFLNVYPDTYRGSHWLVDQ